METEIENVLKLIPMRLMAEIAQTANDSYNWHGRTEYKVLRDKATVLAKEWDSSFEVRYTPAQ